jgi:hypothetical protein
MSAASRRTLLAGVAGLPTAAALSAIAAAHPDAELLRACAEHAANLRAVLASPGCTDAPGGNAAWEAYQRTQEAIDTAEPVTMAGVLAKARVAMSEAVSDNLFEGEHANGFGFTAHAWAWGLVQDLVRLHGIEFEDPHTGAALRLPLDGEATS